MIVEDYTPAMEMRSEQSRYFKNHLKDERTLPPYTISPDIEQFHRRLLDTNVTNLVSLPEAAKNLGFESVWVKDESWRFGLPAFKILGASWAVFKAVADRVGLSPDVSIETLKSVAQTQNICLVSCTDGNWGRSVARMAGYLGIKAEIFVPDTMNESTKQNIRKEGNGGFEVMVQTVDGDYDVSIRCARNAAAESDRNLLVMDVAWDGYEQIPNWVVEGYSTMLTEADRQFEQMKLSPGAKIDLAIASVGVGSLAQAVTAHYKASDNPSLVIAVEPVNAPCLRMALESSKIVSVETHDTIMCGMNCGTVSTTAWPILSAGLDGAVLVTDLEAHEALVAMRGEGVKAGPCGAAPLAALRRLVIDGHVNLDKTRNVILFCTEGDRPYNVPAA